MGKEDNSKIFDLTFLADTLLQKYVHHTKDNKIKNDLKKIHNKIEKELNKEQLILSSEIQTCYRVAEYYKEMNNYTKEIEYLRKILDKVDAAKFEDNRKSLKTIEKTKKRFQKFIEKKHSKSFEIKIWLLKSEEQFEEAI